MTSQLLFVWPHLCLLIASDPLKVFLKDGSDGSLPIKGKDLPWSAAVPQLLSPPAHPVLRSPPADGARAGPSAVPGAAGTLPSAFVTALLYLRCASSVKSG